MAYFTDSRATAPIELASLISEKAKSVCTISHENLGGTGFLISKDLVITADFVVPSDDELGSILLDLDFNKLSIKTSKHDFFLDKAPYPFEDAAANSFYVLLYQAYSSDAARLNILARAGVPNSHVLNTGAPNETWLHAIKITANLGKLRALLDVVLQDDAVQAYHEKLKTLSHSVKQYKAKVVYRDEVTGIAVLKLDKETSLTPLAFGTTEDMKPGDPIVIIQHQGLSYKSFALDPHGLYERNEKTIKYKVDTVPGSAGSPVFNQDMQVVGLTHGLALGSHGYGITVELIKATLESLELDYIEAS